MELQARIACFTLVQAVSEQIELEKTFQTESVEVDDAKIEDQISAILDPSDVPKPEGSPAQ